MAHSSARELREKTEVSRLYRWMFTLLTIRSYAAALNRRVEVENELFAVAAGKRPMLTREECRALAIRLGTPKP